MLSKLLIRLDEKGYPQKIVGWLLSRKARKVQASLSKFLHLQASGATDAVCLAIASPLIATRDLFEAIAPQSFGVWRDYKVISTIVTEEQAVAVLEELRSGKHFTLIVPVHQGFKARKFKTAKVLRLTCEAERARLITVRLPDGYLIAAGTLELIPKAAFSFEVKRA